MVNNLQEAFDKATKKYLDQQSSDEDESLEYPDPRTNVFREKSYTKAGSSKAAQKDIENDIQKKGKEKVQDASGNESEDQNEENDEKSAENRLNKKKRKDKDKRRKKKTKTKSHSATAESNEEDNVTDEKKSISEDNSEEEGESDTVSAVGSRGKKRSNDKSKLKSSEPPAKKAKTKLSQKEKEQLEKDAPKQSSKKVADKKNKKSSKSKHSSKSVEVDASEEEEIKDEKPVSDAESVSDSGHFEKESMKSRSSSKRKHSVSHEPIKNSKKKSVPAEKGNPINNKTTEKNNQNSKSKGAKPAPVLISEEPEPEAKPNNTKTSKNRQTKDNKKSSNGANKKRKGRRKKSEEMTPNTEEVVEEAMKIESDKDGDECETLSRSSSPLFKVDLHEKYAKSASIKDDASSSDEMKCKSPSPSPAIDAIKESPKENNHDDDLLSITSQSLSRSASPFNSCESDVDESENVKPSKANSQMDKTDAADDTEKSTQMDIDQPPSSASSTSYFYLDKYDLIKQRRNRNTEEKWNQIVKEAEKMKDTKKATTNKSSSSSLSKEKNQKLKETIEKLKVKNAKSKERSVLIDEIFGVKPAQQPRDEKTIFEKLRESCFDAKSPTAAKKTHAVTTAVAAVPAEPVKPPPAHDAYDFVDDLVPAKPPVTKKLTPPSEKPNSVGKKSASKKNSSNNATPKKSAGSSNKTNLEALELETEQTLKDINRWLEHTPRFPEFSSASNSPSRYNLLDDFDAVTSKIDPNDFRRPVSISAAKLEAVVGIDEIADNKQDVIEDLIPPPPAGGPGPNTPTANANIISTTANNSSTTTTKSKEPSGTTQFLANPPPPPHVKNQQQKESKRKTLKEKLTGVNRRKDLLRTIDRLQPGKSKGNLLGGVHSTPKTEELFPPAATNKIKEVKNSLVVKTDESGPKLSMGSVLHTEGFGLGQLHNFTDSENEKKPSDNILPNVEESDKKPTSPESVLVKKDESEKPKEVEINKSPQKSEKLTATPNLSAWFKAFGAPKKAKKAEEEEKKAAEAAASSDTSLNGADRSINDQTNSTNSLNAMKSPPTAADTFSLPAPRQRKASTGSTVSERSSFSQDPDSPRVGIDDRFGAYAGPYPSPIGASPIMVSPKPDEIGKPTSPYPLNGAIKVGFYQDTTTKSSPEKSCSPRELPSPYPQYSQHIYSSASSPTVNTDVTNTYASCYNTSSEATKNPVYSSTPATTLFDQYKQPRSQESDYNSMSPNTNCNSPYQQPQNSPYQQHQNSPYQQQNSPYQQSQNSPFQSQSNTSNMMGSSPNSPNMPQTPQQSQGESPRSQPNSPYHQQTNSPYQQPTSSPYHQNPSSPYQPPPPQAQQSSQQPNLAFVQQQQQQAQSNQSPAENTQRQTSADSSPYRPEPPTYSLHENVASAQYQPPSRTPISSYDTDISKQNTSTPNLLNKLQQEPDWNTQMDLSVSQTHQSERASVPMSELSSISHVPNQLNTPPLQNNQMNQLQNDKNIAPVQYPNYSQFAGSSQKQDTSKTQNMFGSDMTMDMSIGMSRHQQELNKSAQQQQATLKSQQNEEADILNLGGFSDSTTRQQKHDPVQNTNQMPEKQHQYDSLQKHQQMFDSFLGSMTGNKNLGFGKSLDIPSSKAIEMFNRAATMGFSKDFSNPLAAAQQKATNAQSVANPQPPQISQQSYHLASSGAKSMDSSSAGNIVPNSIKPLNMASNNYQQQMQQHLNESVASKMSTFPNPMSNPANDINKLQQHAASNVFAETNKHAQQLTATNYSSSDKVSNEGIVPPNTRQDHQMGQLTRSQQLNMDLSGYKTYNNPAAMLDPLRNLNHPLSMMDESLLGLSGSSAPAGYYEKNIPPAAHMFSKNLSQQMYQNPSPYGVPTRDQQNIPNNYGASAPGNVGTTQNMENFETKQTKRKKKKTATPNPTEIVSNAAAMLPTQQQQSLQPQNPQSSQGFQLYSDLKTASSSTAATDTSAISLKTASSMVPGSAFNFGPSPTGLGLPTGMYGDNSGYLDPYYLSSSHRTTAETTNDKSGNAATATASATPYQFLAHNPVRPTYPFMNSQLDPNSPIYQQFRQEQELRARMMINQGLLGSAASAAGSYAQPGYRPPTLGMPKHYDMSRQTWF